MTEKKTPGTTPGKHDADHDSPADAHTTPETHEPTAAANPLAPQPDDYEIALDETEGDTGTETPTAGRPAADDADGAHSASAHSTDADAAEAAFRSEVDEVTEGLDDLLAKEPVWNPSEYAAGDNFGGSAAKLSDSFVAPLVAAARGYRTYDSNRADRDAFRDFNLVRKNTKQGARLAGAILRGDVLLMPWFAFDDVADSAARSRHLDPTAVQFRPSRFSDYDDPEERQRKYEFVSGHDTPLGAHPSTPASWIQGSPVTLIAEGLLKADAALTGWLLSKGVTREQLSYTGGSDPRERLRMLMEQIPLDESLTVISIAGVYNWMQNPEWKSVHYKGREVWLGIDGDVAVNPYVYKAALSLKQYLEEKKRADKVCMLSPEIPKESLGEGAPDEKIGIDDYLAKCGTWNSLLKVLSDEMPPRPPDLTAADGDVRVDPNGCGVSRWEVTDRNANGIATNGHWVPVVALGGRIAASIAERIPSTEEMRSGVFGAGVDESQTDWEIEIEVQFRDVTDKVEKATISGPARILNYPPEQWESKGAEIPAAVLVHPKWPPRGKNGEAWLEAVKGHEAQRMVHRTRWATMGWVPVPGAVPAFIAGNTIIGRNDSTDETVEVLAGVTAESLDRAHAFGVHVEDERPIGVFEGITESGLEEMREYKDEIKQDIQDMLQVYVRNGAWTDRRNAAVVVAAGIRPALPLPKRALPYFTGARGTGKTFSAEAVMGFWQTEAGSLCPIPGSAKDTAAHMELSLARSVIWCIDDLAPASSRAASEDEKNKIGNLIRMYFNGTARGRSNASMGNRKKNLPRALLLITAENEPTVSSERDRVVLCDIGYGALSPSVDPTEKLSEMIQTTKWSHSQAPARISQALVKYLRWLASQPSTTWRDVYGNIKQSQEMAAETAAQKMKTLGGTKRHQDTAADLMISIIWLSRLADHVGCDEWVQALLIGPGGLNEDIISLVSSGHRDNNSTSPGRALVEALSGALRRGRAYVSLADDPSAPPMPGNPAVNTALGWVPTPDGQSWRPAPGADAIGWLTFHKGSEVVLFDSKTAFNVAQQFFPTLIPHGQQERSSWASVTGEGLGEKNLLRRGEAGKRLNTARIMTNGVLRSGYPISLEQVLRGGIVRGEEGEFSEGSYIEDAESEKGTEG